MEPISNHDAEEALLGAVMLDNNALDAALEYVHADDFHGSSRKLIFEAMQKIARQGQTIDIITLQEALGTSSLESVGGVAYFVKLFRDQPTSANVSHHAKIVQEKAVRRKILKVCHETIGRIENTDLDELIAGMTVDMRHGGEGLTTIQDSLRETEKIIEERHKHRDVIAGIPTGFRKIDQFTDGWQPGELIFLGARPSMGKSALAWAWALGAAEAGHKPFIANIEMDNHSMLVRALAGYGDIDMWKIQKGVLRREEWDELKNAMMHLYELDIFFDETIGRANELHKAILRARRKGADIVFVDYLQLLRGEGKNESREREIANISIMLKTTAKKLRIPIIALVQLNRDVERREDKRPVLADLRESGQLEQDGDLIMFLYREYCYTKNEADAHKAELLLRKGRNRGTGTRLLYFNEMQTSFRDWNESGGG